MPLLVMHGGMPAVAIANKTPVAKTVVPPASQDDVLSQILNKLTVIEGELGITPAQEQPTEEEIIRRQMFVEKMRLARETKQAEAEQKRKDFLKRMQKGKRKAAKTRSRNG